MKSLLKRVAIMVLLCSLTLVMTACSKNNNKNQNKVVNKSKNNKTENNIKEINNKEENNSQELSEVNRGIWENNKYTNNELSIKFTLPNDWNKYTDQQLKNMEEMQNQTLNDKQQKMIGNSMIYEVIANNSTNSSNIIITLEPELEITEQEYLEIVKKQLEAITAIKYKILKQDTISISGQEYQVLDVDVKEQNLKQRFYIRKKENSIIGIITTARTDKELEEIKNFFEE